MTTEQQQILLKTSGWSSQIAIGIIPKTVMWSWWQRSYRFVMFFS